jgi:hypothetical protein
MPSILQRINDGNAQEAFNLITNKGLAGFGPTYILTVIFFLTGGQQPIYDRFAHVAALAVRQGLPPRSEVSFQAVRNWNDYEDYKELLRAVTHACGQQSGSTTVPRCVDRALWVYGHLFRVPKTKAKDRHGTTDRTSNVDAAGKGGGDARVSDEGRCLPPIAKEHYEVARSLHRERPGRMFTAAEFKQRYREIYPNRNTTSIMPAGYSVPPSPRIRIILNS